MVTKETIPCKKASSVKQLLLYLLTVMLVTGLLLVPISSCSQDAQQTSTHKKENNINGLSSMELTHEIKVGWNLGDTLDSNEYAKPTSPTMQETGFGNPITTKAMIDAVKAGGFNAVRIPVTWYTFTGGGPDYKINAAWLARVKQVAEYVIDNDMYCIIDAHHEDEKGGWLRLMTVGKNPYTEKPLTEGQIQMLNIRTAALWGQVAKEFKDYDEHLIFDCFNEPRTINSKKEWDGGTLAEKEILNDLYQTFVDTVRRSGGKNFDRHLLLAPYAADGFNGIKGFKLPHDPRLSEGKDSRLMVSIHAYEPYPFTLAPPDEPPNTPYFDPTKTGDTSAIRTVINNVNTNFISKGIPVIIGETGACTRTYNKQPGGESNLPDRITWARYCFAGFKEVGVPCFWWDPNDIRPNTGEGFGLLKRSANPPKWYWPTLVDAIMEST